MLRLIRWLMLGTFVASLLAVAVAFRIHGHTVAEVGCKLAESATCERWAERCASTVRRTLELFDYPERRPGNTSHVEKSGPNHDGSAAHREPAPAAPPSGSPRPALVTTPADGPPLDQHTPQDKRELDHILTSRGSR
jgi:hypothetical protein